MKSSLPTLFGIVVAGCASNGDNPAAAPDRSAQAPAVVSSAAVSGDAPKPAGSSEPLERAVAIGTFGSKSEGSGGLGTGALGSGRSSATFGPREQSTAPTFRSGAIFIGGSAVIERPHGDRDHVQQVVESRFGAVGRCYDVGLQGNRELGGEIRLGFHIKTNGAIWKVASTVDMSDKDVSACVLKALDGLTFPQLKGDLLTVTYSLRFSPRAQP